jgi:hypothetical protein
MEKPSVKRPDFTKPDMPCYDYRNMEDAGQYRGVGERGKVGHMNSSNSVDSMPPISSKKRVPRDHEG